MSNLIQFGEHVQGYDIPVLNEREIRAAAGILFLATYTSMMYILFNGNFILIKYVITLFLLDFLIRVCINPKFSPTLILGRLIVRNQVPEYVGAQQKKFAWIIGVILSAIMFVFFVIVNAFSPIIGLICLICLAFLFFESVFGICLGCKFYPIFHKTKANAEINYIMDGIEETVDNFRDWGKDYTYVPHLNEYTFKRCQPKEENKTVNWFNPSR